MEFFFLQLFSNVHLLCDQIVIYGNTFPPVFKQLVDISWTSVIEK